MLRWSPPSKEKPTVEGKRYFSPTPDDLRALVFDYLCFSSHTGTARAFLKDTAVQPEGDGDDVMDVDDGALDSAVEERFRLAELRRDVKLQILSGCVDDAIALLDRHFPAVLAQDLPHRPQSVSPSVHASEINDTFAYASSRLVDPTHLLLNLRILGFIEATRTIPLPYYPPGTSVPSPSPSHSPLPTTSKTGHVREDSEPSAQQQLLLHKAQKLYSDANCLPRAEDRASYLQELGNVSALLVYPIPEKSPMVQYLSQERREEMAQQVERAILHHTGELAVSKIELAVRYTTSTWNWLHDRGDTSPPQARWPPGVRLPPSSEGSASDAATNDGRSSAGKKTTDKDGEAPRIPTFNLTRFLDSKPR